MMRTVGADHPITLGNLPAKVRKCLTLECPAHYAVLAEDGRRLVGFFRYEYGPNGTLRARGTWVDPKERGRGLAGALWRHVLKSAKPRRVWVKTVSEGGRGLVSALVREFPRIKWTVV